MLLATVLLAAVVGPALTSRRARLNSKMMRFEGDQTPYAARDRRGILYLWTHLMI